MRIEYLSKTGIPGIIVLAILDAVQRGTNAVTVWSVNAVLVNA